MKPESGWAQFIEPKYPFALCDDDSVLPDAPIHKVFFINYYEVITFLYFKYMNQVLRIERQTLLDGSKLEQLTCDAGFIDVDVKVIKCEIGDWEPGLQCEQISLTLDLTKHGVA